MTSTPQQKKTPAIWAEACRRSVEIAGRVTQGADLGVEMAEAFAELLAGATPEAASLRAQIEQLPRRHAAHVITACHFPGNGQPCNNADHYTVLWTDVLALLDATETRVEPTCAKCRQPKAHPFHAPKGIFGSQMETHEFVLDATKSEVTHP